MLVLLRACGRYRVTWEKRAFAFGVVCSAFVVCAAQPITMPPPEPKPQGRSYEQAPWTVTLGGGWSRRLAVISDTLPKDRQTFQRDQRSGSHLSLGIEHWRSATFGYGLQGDLTRWSNAAGAISVADSLGGTDLVAASSRIRVITIGPQVMWRPVDPRGRTAFTVVLSGGYVGYHDAYTLGSDNYKIIGKSFFGSGSLLLDHQVGKQVTIGLRVAYVLALINSFEVELDDGTVIALPNGYTEDVKRLDIGLRLGFALGSGRLHSEP